MNSNTEMVAKTSLIETNTNLRHKAFGVDGGNTNSKMK